MPSNKRGAPDDLERPTAQKVQKLHPSPKRAKAKEPGEKRLGRWRDHAPTKYQYIRDRALTQRMFVLCRERFVSNPDHPIEIVSMVGTTGNLYSIVIDKLPTCDCPHALKGNQCKHIVYVLSKVLRVSGELEYQTAFLSSELRKIFAQAPPFPLGRVKDPATDDRRKPLEGECPICCEDFDPQNTREKIVYCKAACGNNIHAKCFERWAETKTNGAVPCPLCRTPWKHESNEPITLQAHVTHDGYFNVASSFGLSGERDYSVYNRSRIRH